MKLGRSFIDRNLLGIKLGDTAECGSFWSCVDLSWVVYPNLGGGSFLTWKVGHFGQFSDLVISVFGCFGQSLKVIMYALLYVYEWTDWQVLSFVKKSG